MTKLIIFSAPSGAGKSTLIRFLLEQGLNIRFSVSATSRKPRGAEKNGVEYYFLTPHEFRKRIANNEFIEYEEVYKDKFYGTLKKEVDRILEEGMNIVFDVDCIGGLRIKEIYGERALSIFVMPPSVQALRERLEKRGTDSPTVIEHRLAKAEYEMSFASQFDITVYNEDYNQAKAEILQLVRDFLSKDSGGS